MRAKLRNRVLPWWASAGNVSPVGPLGLFTAGYPPMKDDGSRAMDIHVGVTNTFQWVDEPANMESEDSEDCA